MVWFRRADALFALGIGVYILYSALRMGYEAVQSLLDRALPDDERQQIIDIVTSWPGVIGAHDLRTRRSGQTRFIQLHLEMEDMMPLMEAHVLAEQVEHALLYRFPGGQMCLFIKTHVLLSLKSVMRTGNYNCFTNSRYIVMTFMVRQ